MRLVSDAARSLAEWLAAAGTRARVLPAEPHRAQRVAAALGVSDRAMLYAVATQLGAVMVDDGWVRVLGGGVDGHRADLASWNGLGDSPVLTRTADVFCVAFDVLGGLFAMDGGTEPGAMNYFAPDALRWEPLEIPYSAWLRWLLTEPDGLAGFYGSLRWTGWQEEARALALDEAIHTYPPPWTREGKDLARVSRRAVPAREVVEIAFEAARELDGREVPGSRGGTGQRRSITRPR